MAIGDVDVKLTKAKGLPCAQQGGAGATLIFPYFALSNARETNGFTISFWIKPTDEIDFAVLTLSSAGLAADAVLIGTLSGLEMCVSLLEGSNLVTAISDSGDMNTTTWFHYTITWNRATQTMRLWRDGVENTNLGSDDISQNEDYNSNAGLYLMNDMNNNYPMYGALADVRIYKRVLTDAEIVKNYQGLVLPNIAFRCRLNSSTSVTDAGGSLVSANGINFYTDELNLPVIVQNQLTPANAGALDKVMIARGKEGQVLTTVIQGA